jgi:hypothetical protein
MHSGRVSRACCEGLPVRQRMHAADAGSQTHAVQSLAVMLLAAHQYTHSRYLGMEVLQAER